MINHKNLFIYFLVFFISLLSFIVFELYFLINFDEHNAWYTLFKNHVYDEVNTYFLKIFIIQNFNFSFNLLNENYVFITTFFSTIQNYLIYLIVDIKYLQFFSNIFVFSINFFIYLYIFKKFFYLKNDLAFFSSIFLVLSFGYGPFTYNEIFNLITFSKNHLITLARSEAPGNSNICFLISLILLFFSYKQKNYLIFSLAIIVGFFSYFYNTLILFAFFNLIFLFKFYLNKFKFTKDIIIRVSLTIFFFSIWCLLILNSDPYSNLTSVVIKNSPNDLKTIIICIIFILLNLANIYLNKCKKSINISIYLIIFLISFSSSYYSNLITGVSLGGEDHFYYFSNQAYWFSILNILFYLRNIKLFINIFKLIIIFFSILNFFNFLKYSQNYFNLNSNNIVMQNDYHKKYKDLNPFINEKVILLDYRSVEFFNTYKNIDNFLINYFDTNFSAKVRLDKFLSVCKTLNFEFDRCYQLLTNKSKLLPKNISHNYLSLIFGQDKADGFYHSIRKKPIHVNDLKSELEKQYKVSNQISDEYNIIVNYFEYPNLDLLDVENKSYEKKILNDYFLLMKKKKL